LNRKEFADLAWSTLKKTRHNFNLHESQKPARACIESVPLAGGVLLCCGLVAPLASQGDKAYQERDFLSRVRRLTVEGLRAGEGYWSPDGKRLVFQSEREPGNPFYQILHARFGNRRHVAGLFRHRENTCAFFRPAPTK